MTDTPFQDPRSEDYMFRSKWTEPVMSTWWCNLRALVVRSINRHKKIRPGFAGKRQRSNERQKLWLNAFLSHNPRIE